MNVYCNAKTLPPGARGFCELWMFIVYSDESWISQNHTNKYIWHDFKENVRTGRGGLLITGRLFDKYRFHTKSNLVFRGGKSFVDSDYHSKEVFKARLLTCCVYWKKAPSFVKYNASYRSTQAYKPPYLKWRKADIIQWLREKGVSFSLSQIRDELLLKEEIWGTKKTFV